MSQQSSHHEVLIQSQHFLTAVDDFHRSQHQHVREEDYQRFDALCGLVFLQDSPINLDWDNNWFVFTVIDMKKFQQACLKHGWETKSSDDSAHDQRPLHCD